jgi:hypothetical protein
VEALPRRLLRNRRTKVIAQRHSTTLTSCIIAPRQAGGGKPPVRSADGSANHGISCSPALEDSYRAASQASRRREAAGAECGRQQESRFRLQWSTRPSCQIADKHASRVLYAKLIFRSSAVRNCSRYRAGIIGTQLPSELPNGFIVLSSCRQTGIMRCEAVHRMVELI